MHIRHPKKQVSKQSCPNTQLSSSKKKKKKKYRIKQITRIKQVARDSNNGRDRRMEGEVKRDMSCRKTLQEERTEERKWEEGEGEWGESECQRGRGRRQIGGGGGRGLRKGVVDAGTSLPARCVTVPPLVTFSSRHSHLRGMGRGKRGGGWVGGGGGGKGGEACWIVT